MKNRFSFPFLGERLPLGNGASFAWVLDINVGTRLAPLPAPQERENIAHSVSCGGPGVYDQPQDGAKERLFRPILGLSVPSEHPQLTLWATV